MATKTRHATFRTSIALSEQHRVDLGRMLNERLAEFLDLERHAKQAHWNVRSPRFQQLHELFDTVAADAVRWADDLAERAVQLGVPAEGTVAIIANRSRLPESPLTATDVEWVRHVADTLAHCANASRSDIETADDAGDAITADLLTRITGEADKQLWMVEAHLDEQ